MEASSSTPDIVGEDKALKSLLDTFGSAFSLQDITSAFYKSGRDPNLAGEILCETQTNPSTHEPNVSNVPLASRAGSQAPLKNGFGETRHANSYSVKAPMSKRNPVSMGTVSNVIGKNYVWRVARSNGTKPLKVDGSEFSIPVSSTVGSSTSDDSSLGRDAGLNDDVEDFLFEMLGRGFQLERSAIHDVLGRCGYDMRKSLETLLDLAAETVDKRYDVHTGTNSQAQNHRIAESNRFGNNGIHRSRQQSRRYEQEKEVLESLFHAPQRPDASVTASVVKSGRTSRAPERMVSEPLEDLSDEITVISTRPILANIKDEDENSAYQILRKAVKEHRDTMKEYYRAATEAFASGDRARATLLLEKGQYFYNKAREADEESALKIFEISENGEKQDDMPLDLQDHQAKEAIQLLKCHLRSLSGIPSITNLKVNVGKDGRDAEKRKRLIKKLLEREAIKWTEDDTLGTILIRLDEIRPENLSFARK
ncbi:hypothetical protein RND81_07G145600 [Saponaria officinalis]|uniref:DUF1771 domain-containing protein n=1 Tax=Saponaria officinalis TaxID=3572 RepID=A0AAW1JSI6_SAPOF